MSLIVVTFSGGDYDLTTQRIVEDSPKFGATKVFVYDDLWLMDQEFYKLPNNRWLWETEWKRGFGWHVWKTLILLDTMRTEATVGDVLLYLDADTYPIADLSTLEGTALRDGAMFFAAGAGINYQWTKRECFIIMGQDTPKYHNGKAGNAGFFALKVGPWKTEQFLYEWMTYCCNPRCNQHELSAVGSELPGYKDHRTDQSIMTNLVHKYGWEFHPDASEEPQKLFAQINQTRAPTPPKGSRWRNV